MGCGVQRPSRCRPASRRAGDTIDSISYDGIPSIPTGGAALATSAAHGGDESHDRGRTDAAAPLGGSAEGAVQAAETAPPIHHWMHAHHDTRRCEEQL